MLSNPGTTLSPVSGIHIQLSVKDGVGLTITVAILSLFI